MITTLLDNGRKTNLFFDTDDIILLSKWVRENLNEFNLNEEHSCNVETFDNFIIIRGDEDFHEFTVLQITPKKLT
jgi:hypothetical protein